jgi:hypothetical protein
MKLRTIAIATTLLSLGLALPAAALPLQAGVYRVGSRYIQIAQKGRRMCFRGFSTNGVTTASIAPDTKNPGFYRINGYKDTVVRQQDPNILLIGELNNLSPYEADNEFPRDLTDDLKRCLNSQKPFFERASGGRGKRS